jgi:dihydroxy-acid dehydratase
MGTALEVLGLTLPYSSGIPAVYPGLSNQNLREGETQTNISAEKAQESFKAAKYLKNLMELDLKPKFV